METGLISGEPAVLATGLLMIPMALLLAVILPGNTVLPFVDLASLLFLVPMAAPYCKNNIVRLLICSCFILVITLYAASDMAPALTEAAKMTGVPLPEGQSGEVVNLVAPPTTPMGWAVIKLLSIFR